jgi:puromycin-sensitive aminopeptidase
VARWAAHRRFRSPTPGLLHPDIASTVLDVVAATGGAPEFDAYLEHYRRPADPQEENRYLYALASFDQPELANRAFDLALGEVRTQNAPFLLQLLVARRLTGPAIWRRITEEWETLVARFPSNTMPRMLDGVRMLCRPPGLAAEVAAFVDGHPLRAGGRSVQQILERLEVNVAFGEREGTTLAALLSEELAPLAD